jgi:hypothetical protein
MLLVLVSTRIHCTYVLIKSTSLESSLLRKRRLNLRILPNSFIANFPSNLHSLSTVSHVLKSPMASLDGPAKNLVETLKKIPTPLAVLLGLLVGLIVAPHISFVRFELFIISFADANWA